MWRKCRIGCETADRFFAGVEHGFATLTQATKKLAEGEYEIQLDILRRDEIGNLAANFAQMTQSLKQLDDAARVNGRDSSGLLSE
ncbi:HAMP domain-containing protein [Brevibacillus invocatus]|uniref:HAMP domain-containing protein n=1 Tax=Brevibacillus invocatus TaxID=173959 RepID=A0A3M8CGZ8_9BACL|nr:HAMP domain-containing protein [Brevibacillus invocatus]